MNKLHIIFKENVWKVRVGNERFEAKHLIIFTQLVAHDNGELTGTGSVEPYGKDTLVVRQ